MKLAVQITLSEIIDKYDWDAFCKYKGWDPYVLATGRADGHEVVELPFKIAKKIGINIKKLIGE